MHDEQIIEKSHKSNYSASVVSGGALFASRKMERKIEI